MPTLLKPIAQKNPQFLPSRRDANIFKLLPMKTVTGGVLAAKPISLSKAATLLSSFVSSENGASQAVSAYLRRASTAFNELKSLHRDLKSSPVKETDLTYNDFGELDALNRSGGDVSRINHEESQKKMETIDNGALNKKTKKKSKKNIEEDETEKENGKKKRKGDKEMHSEEKKRKKKSKSKEISS